ncbi:MAG: methyltransferase domain-containing protein [Desulfovermiculus sp.]|nr:methyltransferase domain-containing protein [Desulfovermiculus sp.]
MPPNAIHAARAAFPTGLSQPENGFRFGLDSLLLACFAPCKSGDRVLDVGTGCGVVGLGLCLMNMDKHPQVLGVDSEPDMVEAAENNTRKLGLEHVFQVRRLDLRDIRSCSDIGPESFDLAVCNPPYRDMSQGRQPRDGGRIRACFEYTTHLPDFLRAMAYGVKNRGRVGLVYWVDRLSVMLSTLGQCQLEPKQVRMVHPSPTAPANLVLIKAVKKGRPGLQMDPPLFLDHPDQLTSFCPLLSR